MIRKKTWIAGELKAHCQIHTQKRDHACTECGKKFFTKCKLERHFSTHTGEKPHKCRWVKKSGFGGIYQWRIQDFREGGRIIGWRPPSQKSWIRHWYMNKRAKNVTCKAKFYSLACSLCGKCFITSDMLQRHKRVHTNELPYSCTHCTRKFRDK